MFSISCSVDSTFVIFNGGIRGVIIHDKDAL